MFHLKKYLYESKWNKSYMKDYWPKVTMHMHTALGFSLAINMLRQQEISWHTVTWQVRSSLKLLESTQTWCPFLYYSSKTRMSQFRIQSWRHRKNYPLKRRNSSTFSYSFIYAILLAPHVLHLNWYGLIGKAHSSKSHCTVCSPGWLLFPPLNSSLTVKLLHLSNHSYYYYHSRPGS